MLSEEVRKLARALGPPVELAFTAGQAMLYTTTCAVDSTVARGSRLLWALNVLHY